ncbi:hypothetical protein [Paraburkholderia bannensis]|uniref:hypothetical protein n=1 Tax=Paraburkholderia bannensis TaxID=765414 RepID=UPI002AB1B4F4|nr:hypothetical protein [Paraburkholderia bannensis]
MILFAECSRGAPLHWRTMRDESQFVAIFRPICAVHRSAFSTVFCPILVGFFGFLFV